jgi:hypothetical protein
MNFTPFAFIQTPIVAVVSGFDPNAQAFITAADITNPTQQTAINQLVLDLKSYSLWAKMNAIYPFVGGTATTHKFNLKDPRDLDAAYRIVFTGGWTHNANGIQGNGTNAYADTKAAMNTVAIPDRLNHWSAYITITGIGENSGYNGLYDGNLFGFSSNFGKTVGLQNFQSSVPESTGFWNGTVTSTTNAVLYKNGTSVYSIINPTPMGSYVFYLGALNIGGAIGTYNTSRFAFASLGGALNVTNAANLRTAVQAFQTTLGRQI